jgi:hypothetical protein
MMEVIGFVLVLHFYPCFVFRGDYFRFDSVFIYIKKSKLIFLKKKPKLNRNRFKLTGFGSVILGKKPVQTGLARFFSGLTWFFPV